ncbi:MAG: HAD-IIA family hydrolase [Campylobacterales bacterium]|nr:HAD-IIA family hydrolase [Campylobacterales bacterium]
MPVGYLVDVQGTLLSDVDKSPLPGACALIDHLNATNTPYCVVTNNTKENSEDFLTFLRKSGLHVRHYLDPFMVLDTVITEKEVIAFGPRAFENVLTCKGYDTQAKEPKTVLIASDTAFDATAFASMIEAALTGARIVGMHGTSVYAKHGRKYPGVGAILAMLSYATSRETRVIGKPSPAFYETALAVLRTQKEALAWEDICMISDDAKGDLLGAKALGMETILVLSGKCQNEAEIAPIKESIDAVYATVAEVLKESM